MGLRSHEYEDTKTNPAPLSVGIKKGAHPTRNTPHKHTRMRYTHTTPHTTHAHIKKKKGLWLVETRCFNQPQPHIII
ncbi:hypothetical protein CIP107563_01827 [Corynebacterium diphtheriae]|nr:hypothetical protein CIP107563_01827 [Corynebacterium diphtheriae]